MDKEAVNKEPEQPRWYIYLEWYKRNQRSFTVTARNTLCPKCQKRMKSAGDSANKLISFVRDCCSDSPDYITYTLPIMESVFRILIAGGNEPLDAKEILRRLSERRGTALIVSAESLDRLLASDHYYGISQVQS